MVDNASADGSPRAIAGHFPSVRLVRSDVNLGFAGGVNSAAALRAAVGAAGTELRRAPRARRLGRLLDLLDSRPQAALVGPALYYPDGRPQPAAFTFPGLVQVALDLYPIDRLMDTRLNGRIHATRPTPIDHPLGACMLIRRAAWDDVGPLDEGYFMYMEEVDWCRRARGRGWQVWHHPGARRDPPRRRVDPPTARHDVHPAVARSPALLPAAIRDQPITAWSRWLVRSGAARDRRRGSPSVDPVTLRLTGR